MVKRIVASNKSICDINNMPPGCRNRFAPLWSSKRKDILLANGIIHCGLGENCAGYEFARKDPDFHLVIFTRKGKGLCRDGNGNTFTIRAGDIAILPAHCAHDYTIAGKTWDHLWFHFTDSDAWSYLKDTKVTVRKALYLEEIERLLVCYHNEAIRDTSQSADALWHIGESILHYLRRELKDPENAVLSSTDIRLNLLLQEMQGAPGRQWSLSEIARILCFSKIHAIRLFKARTGQTPIEYLTRCRMESAAHRLRYSSEKIHSIANMAGYTDQFAFSVAFSRYHKLSPREFRKRNAVHNQLNLSSSRR